MKIRRPKTKNGFTLVELLVTILILSVGILSTLVFFATAIASTEFSKDVTVAISHAEHILEEMQTSTFPMLTDIVATDWNAWLNGQGMNLLPSEAVTVNYVDTAADPLEISATISWIKKSRTNSITLTTRLTK